MPKTFPTAPAFHESVGLTKREYFAIMMASSHWADKEGNDFSDIVRISVRLADKLIEELSKEENKGGQNE
jgi:hypothetical protein